MIAIADLIENLKNTTEKLNLNEFLQLSDLAYHKFFVSVIKKLTSKFTLEEVKNATLYCKSDLKLSIVDKVRILCLLFFKLIGTTLEFMFFVVVFRIRNDSINRLEKYSFNKNIKYIFMTPLNKKRNFEMVTDVYNKGEAIYAYLPTSNISLVSSIAKKSNVFFINPEVPTIGTIIKMVKYTLTKGILIQKWIEQIKADIFGLEFHKKIYLFLIYQYWAKLVVDDIEEFFKNCVVVLDNDISGTQLALTEELNKRNIKTVQVQHGTYFSDNIEYIPPLCKYMLCCSKREMKIQIQSGFCKNNLFTYGIPFRTLNNIENRKVITPSEVDCLILGSGGPLWYQERLIEIVNSVKSSYFEKLKVKIRPHPDIKESQKKNWEGLIKNKIISSNKSLIEDIDSAKIIISFSMDALTPCLKRKKKTIFCVNYHHNNKITYEFLMEVDFIRFADTSDELIEAVEYFRKISDEEFYSKAR